MAEATGWEVAKSPVETDVCLRGLVWGLGLQGGEDTGRSMDCVAQSGELVGFVG